MGVIDDVMGAIEPAMDKLSEWEQNFMKDQLDRWRQYGDRVRFSEKQLAVVGRVYKKITGDDISETLLGEG